MGKEKKGVIFTARGGIASVTHCRALNDPAYPSIENLNAGQRSMVTAMNADLRDGRLDLESTTCLLCDGNDFVPVARLDRYRLEQPTVVCRTCGLVQSQPRLTPGAFDQFYASDTYRQLYNPQLMTIDDVRFDSMAARCRHRFDYAMACYRSVHGKAPATVLEVGCGAGWNLVPFHAAGIPVTGFEPSPTLVAFGRGRGMELQNGTADEITGGPWDMIILSHVLEHFPDPVAAAGRLGRHLSEKGMMYVEVPNADGFCLGALQNAHTYTFSRPTLEATMVRAGLHVTSFERIGSHMRGMFVRGEAGAGPDLSGEFDRVMDLIRRYDRRERIKDALSAVGILPLIQLLRGRRVEKQQ